MIEKPLEQIAEVDLQALVAQQRAEGRRLDYKLELPGGGNEAIKEFLADVTSFSNTDGGDLILGIRDEDGTAAEVVGVPSDGLDNEITRIENMARDGLEPRLPGFHLQIVQLESGRVALVLRMSASSIAPHRVKLNSRFYARNSRGKYPLDVGELRMAFAATDEMPRKIRELHREAIRSADGENMPVRMEDRPFAILTVAPVSVLRAEQDIDINRETAVLPPHQYINPRFIVALEGMIVHSTQGPRSWAVTHRKGYVDFVFEIAAQHDDYPNLIPGVRFQQEFVGSARSAVARLIERGIEGPWIAMATIKQVRDYFVAWRRPDGFEGRTEAAWRSDAYLGEIRADALNDETLEPLLAAFWRVFGENQIRQNVIGAH